jgi:hypothetical protein
MPETPEERRKAWGLLFRTVAANPEPDPALKGKKNGNCNRTSCQKPGATWFNHSTRAFYCQPCAFLLNNENPDAVSLFGHDLCTPAE